MKQKETNNEIYDISALLDEELGKEGTLERERNRERAWEEYNAQILMDARKNAHLTQAELAQRIGGVTLSERIDEPFTMLKDEVKKMKSVTDYHKKDYL